MQQTLTLSPASSQILNLRSDLTQVLDLFISCQDIADSSRSQYRRTLSQYLSWVDRKGYNLSEIARPQLIEFKDDLTHSGKSALTIGSYLTSLRRFYEWTETEKIYPNVAKSIKTPVRKQTIRKQPLTPVQATDLIESVKTSGSLRDYAIINLLLRTGLRTIEVIRANVGDLTYKGGQRVLLIQGKGRVEKDNFVLLTDKAFRPIEEYLRERGPVSEQDPLFTSTSNNNRGERLTTRTISFIAKETLKKIGLSGKQYTAHSLRHTTGVSILRAGGTLRDAQLTLRHSNPSTTQIYVSIIDEEMRLKNSGEVRIDTLF